MRCRLAGRRRSWARDGPGVGESLGPGDHPQGQLGQLVGGEFGSGRGIGDAQPVDLQFSRCLACPGGAEVWAAVFVLPPTMVGAMRSAVVLHACAPGHPRELMRSCRASPTVGGGSLDGAGHRNRCGRSRFPDRHEHEPGPELRDSMHAGLYEIPPGLVAKVMQALQDLRAVAVEPAAARRGTFSRRTARGLVSLISCRARGNRLRSSALPSCFPAMENGGHGSRPENRSMPADACPSRSRTSPWIIFHSEPLLRRRVSQASESSSPAASWAKPACSRPRDCPPAPAQISTQVSPVTIPLPASCPPVIESRTPGLQLGMCQILVRVSARSPAGCLRLACHSRCSL